MKEKTPNCTRTYGHTRTHTHTHTHATRTAVVLEDEAPVLDDLAGREHDADHVALGDARVVQGSAELVGAASELRCACQSDASTHVGTNKGGSLGPHPNSDSDPGPRHNLKMIQVP